MTKPIHLLFFAIFPILSLFAHNFDQLTISELLLPLILSATLGYVIFMIASFFFENRRAAAMLASILSLIFFSYGHFIYLIKDLTFFQQIANRSYLLISFLITLAAIFLLKKIRNNDIVLKKT